MNAQVIAIYGWDDFGFALAHAVDKLDTDKYTVRYYTANKRITEQLLGTGDYSKGAIKASLRNAEIASSDEDLFNNVDTIYIDAPIENVKSIAATIKSINLDEVTIVGTSAGIDSATGKRTSEIIAQELDGNNYDYVQLGGEKDAYALMRDEPLTIGMASINNQNNYRIKEQLTASSASLYLTQDLATAEIAQALGSVLALYSGTLNGLGYSLATSTCLTAKLATHVKELAAQVFHASPDAMNEQNPFWTNSQWVVCNTQNVNHQLGLAISEGVHIDQAIKTLHSSQRYLGSITALEGLANHEPFLQHDVVRALIDIYIKRTGKPESIRQIVSS